MKYFFSFLLQFWVNFFFPFLNTYILDKFEWKEEETKKKTSTMNDNKTKRVKY